MIASMLIYKDIDTYVNVSLLIQAIFLFLINQNDQSIILLHIYVLLENRKYLIELSF